MIDWPRGITQWVEGDVGYMSIPFTWNLPEAVGILRQQRMGIRRWEVGGPAIMLMPGYLPEIPNVELKAYRRGVLQRVNPEATRTTTGCPNRCDFCGIGRRLIEGEFSELREWPDNPVICDNNLLAASDRHIVKVCERLASWGWCDFNQGLDARFLTAFHAKCIAWVGKPLCRLALDSVDGMPAWLRAYGRLRDAGIAKHRIRTYVLIGYDSGPKVAWDQCEFIDRMHLMALPMWFHELDVLEHNSVTDDQRVLGWDEAEQKRIMQWYYKHRGSKPEFAAEHPPT